MKSVTRGFIKMGGVGGLGSALLLLAGSASAQVPPQPGPQYGAPPAAPPWTAPAPAHATPDHDLWVGRLGLGWYGTRSVPNGTDEAIATPLVGIRVWLTPMLGIDGALGFYTTSGTTTTDPGGASTDDRSRTAFALHGGVPISIFSMTHYSFQITPEMDFGFSAGSLKGPNQSTDYSGILFQVGARAGAEIFFGFMGLPQLSLDASVGLHWAYRSGKTSVGSNSMTHNTSTIGTQQFNSPWEIFTQNLAARYYF